MREIKLQDVVTITEVGGVYTAAVTREPATTATGSSAEEAAGQLCLDNPEVLGAILGADEIPVG